MYCIMGSHNHDIKESLMLLYTYNRYMHHYTKYTFHHTLGCEDVQSAQAFTKLDIE